MIISAGFYEYNTDKIEVLDDEEHGLCAKMPNIAKKEDRKWFGLCGDFMVIAKDQNTMKKLNPFISKMVDIMEIKVIENRNKCDSISSTYKLRCTLGNGHIGSHKHNPFTWD